MSLFWTKARIAELRRLTAEGYSALDVAEIFGVSCNAIIGKRNRLGIESVLISGKHRAPAIVAKPPKKPKEALKPKAAPVPALETITAPQAALALTPHRVEFVFEGETIELKPVISGASAAILALRHDTCRWPNGDPLGDDFHFCMAHRAVGATYCRFHAGISYGSGTSSERHAIRSALRASA